MIEWISHNCVFFSSTGFCEVPNDSDFILAWILNNKSRGVPGAKEMERHGVGPFQLVLCAVGGCWVRHVCSDGEGTLGTKPQSGAPAWAPGRELIWPRESASVHRASCSSVCVTHPASFSSTMLRLDQNRGWTQKERGEQERDIA